MATTPALPTQMVILPIKATANIEDPSTNEGRVWAQVLDILENWQGFRRLYWGRHVEEPGKTQVHIGTYLSGHHDTLTYVSPL